MTTNYLALAEKRGLKLELDNLDLSQWSNDQAKYRKVQAMVERLKGQVKSDGRVYPRYSQHHMTGRIMSKGPNLAQLPYGLLQGDFFKIGPVATEPILFFIENGETVAADFLIGSQSGMAVFMTDHLNFRKEFRQHAKACLYRIMYGQKPETTEQQQCESHLYRALPGIKGKVMSEAARRQAATLPLEVADIAEQYGKVVGFICDEILVECRRPESYTIRDEMYRRLKNWDPKAPPPPMPEKTPLEECLDWLKDCGGVMAMSNNPMAHQLIKAGLAKRGGYNNLGQRTLILVEED